MGLDMYLEKYPRIEGIDLQQIIAAENWFSYCSREARFADSSFKDWCGMTEEDLPSKEALETLRPYFIKRYYAWDTDHSYPHFSISQQVGYWRKANQIHRWFVDHVQNGEDDCDYHRECTKEVLEELLDTVNKVRKAPNNRFGVTAMSLLPVRKGFFFGNYDYDDWYKEDLEETVKILKKVLKTTDFETEMVFYLSSW